MSQPRRRVWSELCVDGEVVGVHRLVPLPRRTAASGGVDEAAVGDSGDPAAGTGLLAAVTDEDGAAVEDAKRAVVVVAVGTSFLG